MGLYLPGAIPLSYTVICTVSLFQLLIAPNATKPFVSQLCRDIAAAFLSAWSLGGFSASSVVMLWALLAPLGALMLIGTAHATPWFVAYLLLVVFSGLIDGRMQQHAAGLPQALHTAFYVLNIGVASAVAYGLLLHFVRERVEFSETFGRLAAQYPAQAHSREAQAQPRRHRRPIHRRYHPLRRHR